MASAGDIHSILYRGDVLNKQFQPKFDPSKKVKRHFPGQVRTERSFLYVFYLFILLFIYLLKIGLFAF